MADGSTPRAVPVILNDDAKSLGICGTLQLGLRQIPVRHRRVTTLSAPMVCQITYKAPAFKFESHLWATKSNGDSRCVGHKRGIKADIANHAAGGQAETQGRARVALRQ